MGGHNRGDVALRVLSAGALREMTIATGLGFAGALAWKFTVADATRARIQKTNKDYDARIAGERKKFEAWLAKQPYDDE